MITKEQALAYHAEGKPGKVEISLTKPCETQVDLSLAYTPGVAEPCREIDKNPDDVYKYTNRGNLVAVISNGTAVLGLGNIGAAAGKPVMEGKGVLFKRFADIDVFDIEVDSEDQVDIVKVCKMMEPTFGGINLEDIKAPECFFIEETLKKITNIPIFHDDQHGTAIISGAGLLNTCEIQNKKIDELKIVFSGAGAAGIACAKFYESLGVPKKNIWMFDSKGLITTDRKDCYSNPYKCQYAREDGAGLTLADVMKGTDVFTGVSIANILSTEMVKSMADKPVIFAMANPDPEIDYNLAKSVRDDLIMATGRSDFPNQVNNVLGFPFIFRGALDVMATDINEPMKVAAAHALAKLAKEPDIPEEVLKGYGVDKLEFGPDYIIPKPLDPRVLEREAIAVAKAAVECGIARKPITDWEAYKMQLRKRIGK